MEYGKRLKELRNNKKLSANALAKQVDLDPTTIYKIEAGVSKPSLDALERICEVLDISLAEFFTNKNTQPSQDPQTYDDKIKNLPEQAKKIIDTVIEVNTPNSEQSATSESG